MKKTGTTNKRKDKKKVVMNIVLVHTIYRYKAPVPMPPIKLPTCSVLLTLLNGRESIVQILQMKFPTCGTLMTMNRKWQIVPLPLIKFQSRGVLLRVNGKQQIVQMLQLQLLVNGVLLRTICERLVHVAESPHVFACRQGADNESHRTAREKVRKTLQSKVVHFSTTEMGPDSNFNEFKHNLKVAAMLWHLNSSFYRFNRIENLTQHDADLKQKVIEEVLAKKLSNEEKDLLINDYIYGMRRGCYNGEKYEPPEHCSDCVGGPREGRDTPILACGSCGGKEVEQGHTQFF